MATAGSGAHTRQRFEPAVWRMNTSSMSKCAGEPCALGGVRNSAAVVGTPVQRSTSAASAVTGGQDFSTGDNCYQIYVCSNSDIPLEDSATVSAAAGGDQTALMSLFTPCGGEFQEGTTVLSGPMLKLGASDGCERDSDCKNGAAIAPHR